eukprot:SAG25_NODE_145_length_13941_cov_48.705967_8_plen_279_part_00
MSPGRARLTLACALLLCLPRGAARRRPSAVELEIRNAVSGVATAHTDDPAAVEGMTDAKRDGRALWARVKSTAFRFKLRSAAMFLNDDENETKAKAAIRETLAAARLEEIEITPCVKALVELNRGEMVGLDHRFKSPTSLFRKVMARMDAAATSGGGVPTVQAVLASIMDVLRFCAVFHTRHYTSAVRATLEVLRENGCTPLKVKNYWGPGDGYQGINTVFVAKSGQPFELQFHTPESFAMKEEDCHVSYSMFRTVSAGPPVSSVVQFRHDLPSYPLS